MAFTWPGMLFLLLLVPVLAGLYLAVRRRRQQQAAGFAGPWAAGNAPAAPLTRRRWVVLALFLAGLTALLAALARPQAVVSLPRVEGTVILAFDVSDSMAADDLQPTRLEAAKTAARQFVQEQPSGVLIGVVVFSDNGFAVQPPTDDQAAILAAIDRLEPRRGTSLSAGIQMSLNTIVQMDAIPTPYFYSNQTPAPTPSPTAMPPGSYSPATIVLLTDGENNLPPDPLEIALEAARRGVRIYSVGIGSPAGAIIKVQGFSVHTRLDEALLKQISAQTGGAYYNAANAEDLMKVYNDIRMQLVVRPEWTEMTAILAGAGILLLLTGSLLSLFWFGRLL